MLPIDSHWNIIEYASVILVSPIGRHGIEETTVIAEVDNICPEI